MSYTPVRGSIASRVLDMLYVLGGAEASSRALAEPLDVPPTQIGASMRYALAAGLVAVRIDRSRPACVVAYWRRA